MLPPMDLAPRIPIVTSVSRNRLLLTEGGDQHLRNLAAGVLLLTREPPASRRATKGFYQASGSRWSLPRPCVSSSKLGAGTGHNTVLPRMSRTLPDGSGR